MAEGEVRRGVASGWKLAYLDGRLEILADKRYSWRPTDKGTA